MAREGCTARRARDRRIYRCMVGWVFAKGFSGKLSPTLLEGDGGLVNILIRTSLCCGMVTLCATLIVMSGVASSASHVSASHLPVITPPASVRRAGGKELREFRTGARITVETGCLACHKIGDVGRTSPGPVLTHIGALLNKARLRRALLNPREPMPAFRRLAQWKLQAIVRLLTLMK